MTQPMPPYQPSPPQDGPPAPAYQPPSDYGWPPPPARRQASGLVLAVAVFLFALTALAVLWSALFFAYGLLVGSITSVLEQNSSAFGTFDSGVAADMMRVVFIAGAVTGLVVAGAHAAAGFGVLRLRSWGRITGLVLGILGMLLNGFAAFALVSSLATAQKTVTSDGIVVDPLPGIVAGAVIVGVFLAVYAFITWTLAQRGREFG